VTSDIHACEGGEEITSLEGAQAFGRAAQGGVTAAFSAILESQMGAAR